MTSYVHRGLHPHWQLYCLFPSQYTETRRKTIRLCTTDSLWGETNREQWNLHSKGQQREKLSLYNSSISGLHMMERHIYTIVETYARRGIPSNWQFYCLFNNTYRKNARKHQNFTLLILSEENPFVTNGLASQRASNARSINSAIPRPHVQFCFINIM